MNISTTSRPQVLFNDLDLYELFRRRLQLDEDAVLSLWKIQGVRRSIALYMWCGLPLIVTVVYIVHECLKFNENKARALFHPSILNAFSRDVHTRDIVGIYDVQGGDVVRQLARLVDYRMHGRIDGSSLIDKPNLESADYPRPFTVQSSFSLDDWLKREGFRSYSSDLLYSWSSHVVKDYDYYIQHWIKAHWIEYCDMFFDDIIDDLIYERGFLSTESSAILMEAEHKWERKTPFLTPGLRSRLLTTLTSAKAMNLVTISSSVI